MDHSWPLPCAESEFSVFYRRSDKKLEKYLKNREYVEDVLSLFEKCKDKILFYLIFNKNDNLTKLLLKEFFQNFYSDFDIFELFSLSKKDNYVV